MPKHDDRHLTTIQLSALLDKQLSEQELAICNAHLQTCQRCQGALAGLRQTKGLLQALPEPALPRSFALPVGVAYLQERPAHQEQEGQKGTINAPAAVRQRAWEYYVRRTLRAASTIAAVIGLVFLVSGLLPLLPHGGGATMTASAPASSAARSSTSMGSETNTHAAATATAQKVVKSNHEGNGTQVPMASPQPSKTPVNNSPSQPTSPLPNLSTPIGQQEVGFTLLVLGIVGALLTRRKQRGRRAT